mmetsp:Transcript_126524/g.366271  ORF Transcript_126524/g.366271 Transcript_126524/m.366271 type:complete len:659 (+) Transcript_126524:94-2070(+)
MSPRTERLQVVYASQTGTAEEVAWDLTREGRRKGFLCSDPCTLDDLDLQSWPALRFAVFVLSTTGQGDPPVNMRRAWQDLLSASLPETFLADLRFSVFGLGDSRYREFNYAARKLFARLKRLGAEPFFRIGLGDDQHDFGLEQELDPWTEGMWAALADICTPEPVEDLSLAGIAERERRYKIEIVDGPPAAPVAPAHLAETPCVAVVRENRSLCTEAHAAEEQDVRNVRLRLPSGRRYEAGDVCSVWPKADKKLVQRFVVETLEMSLSTVVRISLRSPEEGSTKSIFPAEPLTLEDIFTSYVDISAVPPRHFFHVLSLYTEDPAHKNKLAEFASKGLEAKDALYEYCKRERRSIAEIMWDFWTARPPLEDLLSCLPPMRPRQYSIASSPSWHTPAMAAERAARFWAGYALGPCGPNRLAGYAQSGIAINALAESIRRDGGMGADEEECCELELCVAVVRFVTRTAREGHGLCSTFLQQLPIDAPLLCDFEHGALSLPPLDIPLIFVCPGTGLSPCRALVQERHLQIKHARTRELGRFQSGLKDLMFLGFRHEHGDFLYGAEWPMFSSWLSVHIAFSRDDPDRKIYVQDKIEERGTDICDLLDAGARILVCGKAHPMPSQVFDSFVEVLQIHRRLSKEGATSRLREMQRSRMYICDTWG